MVKAVWSMRIRTAIVTLTIGIGAAAIFEHERHAPPPQIEDAPVTRGDVIQTVVATGPLNSPVTVAVGSQVTGVIRALDVDYNSVIKKGQPLAEIAPDTFQIALTSAEATRQSAAATLSADQATLDEDQLEAGRIERLYDSEQETAEDRDNAALAVEGARLKIRQDEDVIANDDAGVRAAEDNLSKTHIMSPVDGVVIERDVEVGQTINAATASPTLYEVATDLSALEVTAALDEADVPEVSVGEPVSVSVDAYPGESFPGTIKQVRLSATTVNNVVTYPAIVSVPNPRLRLLPGMTASVTVTVNAARDSLRVPIAALRFRATGALTPGPHTIYVRSGDQPVAKRVIVAAIANGLAAVTPAPGESLDAGDRVITAIVAPGDKTRPAPNNPSRNPFAAPARGRFGRGF
jgi:HlyD family secretion protein